MDTERAGRAGRYGDYRQEVAENQIVRSLRAGILIVVGLHLPVLALDYAFFREDFVTLAGVRLSNAATLAVFWVIVRRWPVGSMIAALIAAGAHLVAVIAVAGGVSSLYYPAIMLLFLGMPVLLPLTSRQAALVVSVVYVLFATQSAFGFGEFPTNAYLVNLLLPALAAVECVLSCALLDDLKFQDYLRREEIAAARDELAQLDDAKTRFSANVHHELRTPLTLMLAPVDGLRDGDYGETTPEISRILGTMRSNGHRLLKLINNLLDLAKLENQQFSISRQPMDLVEYLEDIVEGTRSLAELKSLDISVNPKGEIPSICADRDAFDKIMINLVGNAMKFTDPGGSVVVEIEGRIDGVEVSVVDTGVGLEASQLDRIFDRFAQVDCSATRKHEGTGIGLSLAMELVGLHNGRIWATSEGVGRGTSVHVFLPFGEPDASGESLSDVLSSASIDTPIECAQIDDAGASSSRSGSDRFVEMDSSVRRWIDQSQGRHPDSSDVEPSNASRKPRVLVVDDNADMRELLAFILGKEFRIRTARNGIEALESLNEFEPSLVVTDIMMPKMSGTELCEAIKSNDKLMHIPVMIVSSKAEGEMKARGLELGADDYVTKPFHPREVLARARSLVRLREAQQAVADRNIRLESALDELRLAQGKLVQSERLAAVGELAAGIAHEVNNPVNFSLNAARAIRAMMSEIEELANGIAGLEWSDAEKVAAQGRALQDQIGAVGIEELASSVEELGRIVCDGLERTQKLVGDLRDFAVPSSKSDTRSKEDLVSGFSSTLELVAHEFSRNYIRLDVNFPKEPIWVLGDLGALNQILLNLLKNSIHAFEGVGDGEERRQIVRLVVAENNGEATVRVMDNGSGISPEIISRIFEPFYTTREAGRGSGLGLSMSRSIAEAHGGTLTVKSQPGRGSEFTLSLPIASADSF